MRLAHLKLHGAHATSNPQIVGVSIDGQAAIHLLHSLVAHPHHHHMETAPALTASSCKALIPKIIGYQQAPDATLLQWVAPPRSLV
jgi:hypothetical protein